MQLAAADLRRLAARAMSLVERLAGAAMPVATAESVIDERLAQWCRSLGETATPGLERRGTDGLSLTACRQAVSDVELADTAPLPSWAEHFQRLLTACEPRDWTVLPAFARKSPAQPDKPMPFDESEVLQSTIPFVELIVPFVESATATAHERASCHAAALSPNALESLQFYLLARLGGLAALALSLEFKLFVLHHDPLSPYRPAPVDSQAAPRLLYEAFVRELGGGGLVRFFQEYAVLARLVATVVEHWIEFVVEFLIRLAEDRPAISASFNHGQDPGELAAVQVGLSDAHNRGRSVLSLRFSSGLKLIYKPKDLGIDAAYFRLLAWLNEHGSPLPLRTLRVLDRGTHGWVEFAEHEALADVQAAQRYYYRVGDMLCLVYAFQGTDFHLENLIAAGEQPVLIDLETMCQAVIRPWDVAFLDSADRRALAQMDDSVLRSGLLPSWVPGVGGMSFDLSGLGGEDNQDTGNRYPYWEHINTDWMKLNYRSWEMKPEANVPMLDGQRVSARDHVEAMRAGFADCYRLLIEKRDELLSASGPLMPFRGLKLRQVLRSTRAYATIARRLLHPEFLRDGLCRGLELERLARVFLAVAPPAGQNVPWGMFNAEVLAMESLDIPFFNVLSDGTDLHANQQVVAVDFFEESGLERVRRRIAALSRADLARQDQLIQAACAARWGAKRHLPAPLPSSQRLAAADELLDAARRVADEIGAAALRGRDGSAAWISLNVDPVNERLNVSLMPDNLYDGRLGVALFLAAFEHTTGDASYRELTEAALVPIRQLLRRPSAAATAGNVLGGMSGLGSQLYALLRIGVWLDDSELLELARKLAACYVPERIARDEAFDVISGSAGGLLALLALASQGSTEALESALLCGEHLLKKRLVSARGQRTWKVAWSKRPLTGFAHGAAGIACALTRLGRATGEAQFLHAAREACAFEEEHWSEATLNWADLRDRPLFPPLNAWCYGATGIGLARLDMLSALDEEWVRDDLERALRSARAAGLAQFDHPCCGNLGRIELFLEGARRLARPELLDDARRLAADVLDRARQAGGFLIHAHVPDFSTSPSFFQGLAGIGYQLLRAAQPHKLPSVLLLE